MICEVISTGDEVLTGFITDTNASWISQELLALGIYVNRRHSVSDRLMDIVDILMQRSQIADVIIVSGGLGPTSDDNTTQAACIAANDKLILKEQWLLQIKKWHDERGRIMPKTNEKQAMIPSSATMIENTTGTACGFYLKINKALCFFTPGVPHELKVMFNLAIKPYLQSHFCKNNNIFVKRLFLFGIAESALGQKFNQEHFDHSITIGYRAAYPVLELKLICNNSSDSAFNKALAIAHNICQPYLICEDNYDLVKRIANKLQECSVCIIDSISSGLLAYDLSDKLNLQQAILTKDNDQIAYLLTQNQNLYDYIIALRYDKQDNNSFRLDFIDNKQAIQHTICYTINITLNGLRRQAINLLVQSCIYNLLEHKDLLQPDNSQLNYQVYQLKT